MTDPTPNSQAALARAELALDGLSVGDAFGQRFFGPLEEVVERIRRRELPAAPWRWTDDTAMGLAVFETLRAHGAVNQDALAAAFADGYSRDVMRGYGGTAHQILQAISLGESWVRVAGAVFGGGGSMGNGSAMRVAPVGAYFADDLDAVVEHAARSAEPTHMHDDGRAGAVAVALATALAWQRSEGLALVSGEELLTRVTLLTPAGPTRDGLIKASNLPFSTTPEGAANILGNGSQIICSDTVPFALWCAARHLEDFDAAMWSTVTGLGDRDTTCAIVGGVVAMSQRGIPAGFLGAREPLSWPIPAGTKRY